MRKTSRFTRAPSVPGLMMTSLLLGACGSGGGNLSAGADSTASASSSPALAAANPFEPGEPVGSPASSTDVGNESDTVTELDEFAPDGTPYCD